MALQPENASFSTLSPARLPCLEAELLFHKEMSLVPIQLPLLAITLMATIWLTVSYNRSRIAVHRNFFLLFANIVLVAFLNILFYFIYTLRLWFLSMTYNDPCELMYSLWVISLLLGPRFLYAVAYPALHFCLMVERARAILLAEKYEVEGPRMAHWMLTVIWLFSLLYMAFVVVAAYLDPVMANQPYQSYPVITGTYSGTFAFWVTIVTLPLVIGTAVCDWRITTLNNRRRKLSQSFTDYSLSRNYQLQENAFAMRLVLPLDISYALFYTLFVAFSTYLRAYRSSLTPADFTHYFDYGNTLLYFYSAVTMVVYVRFVKYLDNGRYRRIQEMPSAGGQAKIYFTQLQALWK